MCGIWAIFGLPNLDKSSCFTAFPKISYRGPESWRIEYDQKVKNGYIGFHRLIIVDSTYGMQPMKLHKYPRTTLICNGELYNCKRLAEEFKFEYETLCDVECILHLYNEFGIEKAVKNLDGVFAFCVVDYAKMRVCLARDPYGVRPLFRMRTADGILGICSEAKGLVPIDKELNGHERVLEPFPPGTFEEYQILEDGRVKLLQQASFHDPGLKPAFRPFIPYEDLSDDVLANIRTLFTEAVRKRLMANRRIGCLLSGGLDSSLVASLVVKLLKEMGSPYPVQTFSIGMGDSPDILAARKVADHIGSEHHEIIFTEEDVAKYLDEVIYHLETPDITTVRASMGMYIMSKWIKENTDSTVIFSGEGADEVAQGYIYYRDAPSDEAALEDSKRLLREIYLFDGLRADRTTAAHSLELRVPFLDQQFCYYYLNLPKEMIRPKNGVEKYLIRSAFDSENLLPRDILWRHKEAFSDGVTSRKKTLFQILQGIVETRMTDPFDEAIAAKEHPHCTPKTKEAYYYRQMFEKDYPGLAKSFIPYFWMPRWINVTDPSARFIKHYNAETETNVKTSL
ncbi:asparagine synthetase [Holotrichia oblita]|uniref:Asparagine synthetase n=1 Tax=Holotrichia oblita TaxID=644536 RepID=A0ACB9TBU7_HOLOL|nr:asparagine synthetase [Holotrichia oblita]